MPRDLAYFLVLSLVRPIPNLFELLNHPPYLPPERVPPRNPVGLPLVRGKVWEKVVWLGIFQVPLVELE